MRTRQALMNEFGAAMQFFDGFGENWYALNECLCYMDEWLPGDGYILVVTGAKYLLIDEDRRELDQLIQTLEIVGEEWRKPITDNERFNRGSIPFHVILQCAQDEIEGLQRRFGGLPILDR